MKHVAAPGSLIVPSKVAFKSLCPQRLWSWTHANAISKFPRGPQPLFSLFLISAPARERATQTRPTHLEASLSYSGILVSFFPVFSQYEPSVILSESVWLCSWLLCVKVRLWGLKSSVCFPSSRIPYTDTGFIAALLFPLAGGKLHEQFEEWCEKGPRCCLGLLVTKSGVSGTFRNSSLRHSRLWGFSLK